MRNATQEAEWKVSLQLGSLGLTRLSLDAGQRPKALGCRACLNATAFCSISGRSMSYVKRSMSISLKRLENDSLLAAHSMRLYKNIWMNA